MLKVFALLVLSVGACTAIPRDHSSREFTSYRLPNTTVPTHYELYLDTNVHLAQFEYKGNVKISITVLEDTKQIVLHSVRSKIDRLQLRDSNQLPVSVHNFDFDEEKQFLIIKTNAVLPVGASYVLDIDFTNSLDRNDAAGFYRSSYVNEDGETKYLGLTQFESCDARSAFPCYDEPGIKTTYDIKISCGIGYHARANSPALGIILEPNGKKLTSFQTTPRMQTYLVAFLVSDFISERQVSNKPHQVAVSTFARPTARHQLSYSVDASVKFLREMENYFNQSYAMSKIDNVAVDNNDFAAGAMENWGLVTYRESTILFDPETQGESMQVQVVEIVGHEYTHQFFGNLLAPKWWSYLWLNEGFARLYQHYVSEFSHPELNMRERFAGVREVALNTDADPKVRPMTYYVETTEEIKRLFDNIAYAKAASVLRMLNYALTERTFQKGLRYYIQQNKESGVVDENDLFDSLQQAVSEDAALPLSLTIHEIFSSWSQQPGAPVVSVKRVGDTNEFIFSQERLYNEPQETPNQQSWWIPISYFTSTSNGSHNSTAAFWMPPGVSEVSYEFELIEDEILLINPLARGYYRVNYEAKTWEHIVYNLKKNMNFFHRLTRSQLIDDSMSLAHAGQLDYHTAFELFDYLQNETEYIPWATASTRLKFLKRMLQHDNEASKNLETYGAQLSSKLLSTYGIHPLKGESVDVADARLIALEWACKMDGKCENESIERFSKMKTRKSFVLNSKSQQLIVCNRLRTATYNEYASLKDHLRRTRDRNARNHLINAIACAKNKAAIDDFLNTIKSDDLESSEKLQVLKALYQNSLEGLNAVVDLFYATSDIAGDLKINQEAMLKLLEDIAEYTIEPVTATKMDAIAERHAPSRMDTVRGKLQANRSWIRRNAAIVASMLDRFGK